LNGYAKFLVENKLRGYIYPFTTRQSAEALKVTLRALKGEKLPKTIMIEVKGYGPEEIKKLVQPKLSDWWWIGDDQISKEFLPKL
jgi:hypothetical protein